MDVITMVGSSAQAVIVEPLIFVAKGFRVDGTVSSIDVRVTHVSDNLSQIAAGTTNFRTKHKYFIGGHLLCIRFGLADGAQLIRDFEPVWAGVRGARRIVDRTTHEMFVEADAGDTLHVYYPDGVVAEVTVATDGVMRTTLAPEAALEKRLEFVESLFARVADFTDLDERARKQDRNFHELAALLRLTALYPDFREKITRTIGVHTKRIGGRLNQGVRNHLRENLEIIDDSSNYWWLSDTPALPKVTSGPVRYGDPSPALSAIKVTNAKKVDGELHGMIDEAIKSPGKFPAVRDELKRRSLAGELRPGVRNRFCLQCPADKSELSDEVSKYPVAVKDNDKRGPSPLGSKTMSREERVAYEKRRDTNRAARNTARPARGSSPAADPHGKGKGKQKDNNGRKH
ncbi:MAG: hypothetical protein UY67_C0020G0025 [Candidatus Kaiserbacteria bacterium GW2011_GWA2_52_12]|uniref:Uncharacterized protein n=1 Tax=Candidatus Kaiserbacteria bacterium GW2011_GWA2_52_12 TaxID=1618671 RepID=A0A0G1WY27_9BACT|nr:MAG: hypothetical protein UY67_C0020G0025 [Candidatus Kaiserbacteria bacterium GW2011_GWA2_52_12]